MSLNFHRPLEEIITSTETTTRYIPWKYLQILFKLGAQPGLKQSLVDVKSYNTVLSTFTLDKVSIAVESNC